MSNEEKHFQITTLDPNGDVVLDYKTEQSWGISELQVYIDRAKVDLYIGKIKSILIEEV